MSASFPSSIKSFTTKNTNDTIQASHVDDLQDEVVAIETAALTVGSFTPAVTSSGGGAATYSVQVGRYVKIGRLVHINGRVTLATKGTLAVGTVTITGLPFASENTSSADAGAVISSYTLTTAVVSIFGTLLNNTSAIVLAINTAAATSGTSLTVADMSATSTFVFSATYVSAS